MASGTITAIENITNIAASNHLSPASFSAQRFASLSIGSMHLSLPATIHPPILLLLKSGFRDSRFRLRFCVGAANFGSVARHHGYALFSGDL